MRSAKPIVFALLLLLTAFSGACNFIQAVRAPQDGSCDAVRRWMRWAKSSGASPTQVCSDLSRYVFQSQVFSPYLEEGDGTPVDEVQQAVVSLDGRESEVSINAQLFSTRGAWETDPLAKTSPEIYDHTEYQVGYRDVSGSVLFSAAADTVNDALVKSVKDCHRRLGVQ